MERRTGWPWALAGLAILALSLAVLLLAPMPAAKALASLMLSIVLPGALLYRLLFRRADEHTWLDAALWALGLGYACALVVTLGLHYLPGTFTRRWSLGVPIALLIGLLLANLRWSYAGHLQRATRQEWLIVAALTVLAGALRLINLSYSEFQGDEVAVLHKAAAAIQGRDDALFLHRKGPVEILLPLLAYSQGMAINEWGARLPFALASIAAVLTHYRLGVCGFGQRAGVWVGLLAALNGFFVAFGRIVQYQSLVLWFGALGVLAALCYRETRQRRYLWLSALFLALGLLAHTDAMFAILPAAWLVLRATPEAGKRLGALLRTVAGPLALGLALLAAFYLPYVTSATFRQTAAYLSGRMGAKPPYNNLSHLLEIGAVYNAVHYLALVGALLAWVALRRSGTATRLRWVAPVTIAVLLVQVAEKRNAWAYLGRDWVGILFFILAVLALIPPTERELERPALLWVAVPFLAYMFAFQDPRTHVYVFFPGAMLLAGQQLAAWQQALGERRWFVTLGAAPWLLVVAVYLLVAFVSSQPEYRRTYPDSRIHAFWVPFGDELPKQGLFGFPYRAGWKAVGELYADGVLAGDYGSNEERHITRWYTRAEITCGSDPRYFIVATNVQDEQKIPRDEIAADYGLVGRIWVGEQPKIEIYERNPTALAYRDYDVATLSHRFDRLRSGPWYDAGLTRLDPLEGMVAPLGARLDGAIELVGYTANRMDLGAGDSITVTLYWRALQPIPESYTAFVHIEGPGVVWSQRDGIPRCGNAATNDWGPGSVIIDPHVLWLGQPTPPGPHELVVGMYRADTGERLPVTLADGTPSGDAIHLGHVQVRAD
jgi:hypothetical protein